MEIITRRHVFVSREIVSRGTDLPTSRLPIFIRSYLALPLLCFPYSQTPPGSTSRTRVPGARGRCLEVLPGRDTRSDRRLQGGYPQTGKPDRRGIPYG